MSILKAIPGFIGLSVVSISMAYFGPLMVDQITSSLAINGVNAAGLGVLPLMKFAFQISMVIPVIYLIFQAFLSKNDYTDDPPQDQVTIPHTFTFDQAMEAVHSNAGITTEEQWRAVAHAQTPAEEERLTRRQFEEEQRLRQEHYVNSATFDEKNHIKSRWQAIDIGTKEDKNG